jgi:Fe-S cluster biosynthesis and repair protein YggX
MTQMVHCVKLGRELPGLTRPPYPGELGLRIQENVSQEGWSLWLQHMALLINHYGLNLADPRATEILREEMEKFFFGEDAEQHPS